MDHRVIVHEVVYKEVNGHSLTMRLFCPAERESDLEATDEEPAGADRERLAPAGLPRRGRPAILIFFGGGWTNGSIEQFREQSEILASRGYVAITPEYRIASKHGSTPFDSVADAKDALDWVTRHADEWDLDVARIAVAGGSAGGHLALCAAMLKDGRYDAREAYRIPKALVLWNPVCDTSGRGFGSERLGDRPLDISPMHHVEPGLPPALLFHGTADQTVPYEAARRFRDRMADCGNDCRLVAYPDRKHGFFNRGRGEDDSDFFDTLNRTLSFLNEVL